MANAWQDRIVGARMAVDDEFADTVRASSLSRSQWGLVMTATEFEIEHADDPDAARMVADTSKLEHVLPEMDKVDKQMQSMGGAGGGSSGGDGGVMGGIKRALGLGGSGGGSNHDEIEAEATSLAQQYAEQLQSHLESSGRWEEIRRLAAED